MRGNIANKTRFTVFKRKPYSNLEIKYQKMRTKPKLRYSTESCVNTKEIKWKR